MKRWFSMALALPLLFTPVHADAELGAEQAAALAAVMPRASLADESIYFVMIDRYANGNTANDRQGGFDPTNPGYYHGGDLAGLTANLDRIKRLGFTAVWITPPFVNNTVQGDSAAYHGYWINDFTTIDPHFGTPADFAEFVSKSHALGLKVYLDIVMNHTGDVIRYSDGYNFGAPGTKKPYIPQGLQQIKAPAFLNDLTNFHNQGNVENWNDIDQARNGDFYGLDDIKTENEVVVEGFASLYANWITKYHIDGFRIDTAKHVDATFFGRWLPRLISTANLDVRAFNVFGEVYDNQPDTLASYVRDEQLPSVLDFGLQPAVTAFASGDRDASRIFGVLAADDLYNVGRTADGWTANAYSLPVFGGNHDMGRTAMLVSNDGGSRVAKDFLPRVKLAHALLFLLRGAPVTYYGDEVGMVGYSGDQGARQDMFPTKVTEWQEQDRVGSQPIGKASSLIAAAERLPLAVYIKRLNHLRTTYAALRNGALLPRVTKGPVAAWSRVDSVERREFVVAVNNSTKALKISVPTATPNARFTVLLGSVKPTSTNTKGDLPIVVPPLSAVVLRSQQKLPNAEAMPFSVSVTRTGRLLQLSATATSGTRDPASVTFVARPCGTCGWESIATDDAAPYSVALPASLPDGASIAAITRSSSGSIAVGTVATVKR